MAKGQETRRDVHNVVGVQRVQSQQPHIEKGRINCEVENAAASEAKSQIATGLRDMSLSISMACDAARPSARSCLGIGRIGAKLLRAIPLTQDLALPL